MDGVGKPTQITLEQGADVVIRKGAATVELRADGSVYVNGKKVTDGIANDSVAQPPATSAVPAARHPEEEPAPQQPATQQPAAEQVDPEKRRRELVKEAIRKGKSGDALMQYVNEMMQMEEMQRDSGPERKDPSPSPAMPAPVAEEQSAPLPQQTMPQPQPPQNPPAPAKLQIGRTFEDKGVFIGTWEPTGKNGSSLGKIFNVFAAPEDLTDDKGQKLMLTFNQATTHVAKMKNWHGHDGGDFANQDALIKALRKDSYKGEWVIPPIEMMAFLDDKGEVSRRGILVLVSDIGEFDGGDLAGTFEKVGNSATSQMYWTCTETPNDPDYMYYADMSGDTTRKLINYLGRDKNKLATRLVRLEPRA